jgi:taurine dioxygenase
VSSITITPIAGSLGAEVTGIDLSKPLDNESTAIIEDAFLEHLVLCFRDQHLDPTSLLEITEKMGGVGVTPYLGGLSTHPDVVPVIKEPNEKSALTFGSGWHTDFTFQAQPPSRTLLYAVDVPQVGGDTLYGPKATLKDTQENMTIINDSQEPEAMEHPVIRTHPQTGKKALWINPVYTIRFKDMTEQESQPLLNYLNALATTPSNTCRVRWQKDSLTVWDNRCTQHCATSDYQGHRREMLRTTVAGDQPF